MKITQSPLCSFCRETDETIEHLFWECDHVQSLLQSIDNYCMNILASSFNVQKQDFILGDVKGSNEDNLICIQIKYYIYTMRCLSKRLSVEGAIAYIKSLAKTCQQIALEKGQIHIFNNRWRNWILIIWSDHLKSLYIPQATWEFPWAHILHKIYIQFIVVYLNMYYTIFRNCLNNIYVTLPGTILHIFSNSDKIERILA